MSQTDASGRLTLGAALDDVIDCVIFQLDSLGEFSTYLQEQGLGMFQVHVQVDILRRPKHGENLSIETNIYECSGIRGYRNTLIRDEKGRVCFATFSTGAFVSRETGRPCKVSQAAVETLDMAPRYEMEYLPPKIALPTGGAWVQAALHHANSFDLDMNGHVNSNRYVELAEEQLPEGFTYNRVRVEYRHQTKPGEDMVIESCREGDTVYVRITNDRGEPKAIVSFSTRA